MLTSRSVVPYDDIIPPYTMTPPVQNGPFSPHLSSHKKRKLPTKHKDPSTEAKWAEPVVASSQPIKTIGENLDDQNESRELTHEEIWDDTALVDAWNAATAEYETYNGLEQAWKNEPIHQSPLWYNIPWKDKKSTSNEINGGQHNHPRSSSKQDDSNPLNFDTFVPDYDPSLAMESPQIPEAECLSQHSGGLNVSRSEAFSRAMGAMYWSGYWTAMYHASYE